MERIIIPLVVIVFLAGAAALVLADDQENFGMKIGKSRHNFSHAAWLPVSRICQVCHTHHNEKIVNEKYPAGLGWKSSVRSVTYNMYHSYWGSSFFDTRDKTTWTSLTGRRSNLPDGLSKLCLACHEGIVAPDVFKLHHFVSVLYDDTITNLRDPDVTVIGNSGSISEVLDGGKIQCTSCHDVHGVESVADTKLLRAEKPEICTLCHIIELNQ